MKKKKKLLKPVMIYLEFDPVLQPLTGTARETIEVSEGTPFLMFMQAILESYPNIMKNYSLSSLSFSINGLKASLGSTLTENDVVTLLVANGKGDDYLRQFLEYQH